MNIDRITSRLKPGSLFAGQIQALDCVDSTNTRLKELARQGAPEGAVLLAEEQTAGRGTQGRAFCSPRGEGLYLSLLLRPQVSVADLLTLTGRTAVAVMDGIRDACGAPVAIKWLNDIYLNGRKLCGILTEFSPGPGGWVVVGIGVNGAQSRDTFRAQGLETIATSLAAEGCTVSREALAAAILNRMEEMYRAFPGGREEALARYQANCLTLGRPVSFFSQGRALTGAARAIDRDFALVVEDTTGTRHTVSSGTVTLL